MAKECDDIIVVELSLTTEDIVGLAQVKCAEKGLDLRSKDRSVRGWVLQEQGWVESCEAYEGARVKLELKRERE